MPFRILRRAPSTVATALAPSLGHFAWLLGREPQPEDLGLQACRSVGASVDDRDLVRRVQAAYRLAISEFTPSASGWDSAFFELKKDLHDSFLADDDTRATTLLRDPASNTHFWGFDAISMAPPGHVEPHELVLRRLNDSIEWTSLYALWTFDALKNLAEAVGAKRTAYPEIDVKASRVEVRQTVEELLSGIEGTIGMRLEFPNPYPGEWGLESSRGVIGFRAVQAVYQAWRIRELSRGRPGFKVLEIGPGLGRTAFFAARMGITDYALIDIPMTNAAQGYFLGRVLGPQAIRLHGESGDAGLRILPPTSSALSERYDLVVNVDSLTEMDASVSRDYWAFIRTNAAQFLSINHEFNPVTVRSLYAGETGLRATRHPYWMRRGYVEELITLAEA